MTTDKCSANQYAWFALVSLLRGASFMEFVPVDGIPTVSYSVLNAWLGQQGLRLGTDRQVGLMALDCVEWYCLKHNLPDLTALVMHHADRLEIRHSGDGFFESNQIAMANRAIRLRHWLHIATQVVDRRVEYPVRLVPLRELRAIVCAF